MKKVLIILMLILINNAALAQNIENEEYTAENIINFISRMDIEDVDDAMYFLKSTLIMHIIMIIILQENIL